MQQQLLCAQCEWHLVRSSSPVCLLACRPLMPGGVVKQYLSRYVPSIAEMCASKYLWWPCIMFAGVKESEIKPVIAFLRQHLGLSDGGVDRATQQGAAAVGGEEPLSTEGAEELAEVQFPSS